MPSEEITYEQAVRALSSVEGNELSPEIEAWFNDTYREAGNNALRVFDEARMAAWRIYNREQAAAFWQRQVQFAKLQLQIIGRMEPRFVARGIPAPEAVLWATQTAQEILEACEGAYELLA